ncbi:DUF791-domain-containing protein [Pleomassaria siparia CBS 279.74]|uniref:Molybdate-anion transporter n=1 Tax=Pleomassaria siparia CBS 279.74 TaxID=1314801 RepID=A0A6G1JVP6_9PLEO|nr:DUF791-domain-containing protein [Pleomassaria siparia CBS 279.74]
MDLYQSTLVAFLVFNVFFLYRSYRKSCLISDEIEHRLEDDVRVDDRVILKQFKWRFLPIYLLVNGSDWLHGPYIYPIYKDEKGLPEEVVAALFLVGFLAGGISASFTGALADRYGRRSACLSFCVLYSLSACTLLADNIVVLFFGRILGGVSATLLYSVFESWMVTEFNRVLPDEPASTMSGFFSTMTTLNSVVAISAGVLAEWVVKMTGTAKAPFMTSVIFMGTAFVMISKNWKENYGWHKESPETGDANPLFEEKVETLLTGSKPNSKSALRLAFEDPRILVLGLTSCFFEGSLFLFIFFKFPALKLSHKLAGSTEELSFGIIFATLMCSMMLGSMLHQHLSTSKTSIATHKLLAGTLMVAAMCFFIPVYIREEAITLWCFCGFEACCGIYFPLISYLRGQIVEDGARASIYGMLRIPLNIFVVVALSTTKEGEQHRDMVFMTCGGLLLVAAVVVNRALK